MALQMLKNNLKNILNDFLNFEKNKNKIFTPKFIKYSFADELICGPLILKNFVIDSRKKRNIFKQNLKTVKNLLVVYFQENLNKIRYLNYN